MPNEQAKVMGMPHIANAKASHDTAGHTTLRREQELMLKIGDGMILLSS